MSTEKKYVGKAKKVSTKFGEIINASFKLEDLKAIVNEKGYVNVTISEMKQADKYGYTHTAYLNDYQPKAQVTNADDDLNSLPF